MITHVCNTQLQPSARLILIYMSGVKSYSGTLSDLGRKLAISYNTVQSGLKRLDNLGFVSYDIEYHPIKKIQKGISVKYLAE